MRPATRYHFSYLGGRFSRIFFCRRELSNVHLIRELGDRGGIVREGRGVLVVL